METVADFLFLGSKITADSDCSHEMKRHLLLGRKAMTNLGSILESRDITLATKCCLVKAIFFPVVMYGCESWTVDAFELCCWRRLLRVPWTAKRSNQSILNPCFGCLLMCTKEESEKFGLKLNIQKIKIIASSPITSWQIDEEKWKELKFPSTVSK